jgi:hypothetical protein
VRTALTMARISASYGRRQLRGRCGRRTRSPFDDSGSWCGQHEWDTASPLRELEREVSHATLTAVRHLAGTQALEPNPDAVRASGAQCGQCR